MLLRGEFGVGVAAGQLQLDEAAHDQAHQHALQGDQAPRELVAARLVEREPQRLGHLARVVHVAGVFAEELPHLELRAQKRFGVRLDSRAGGVERRAGADAVHHVRQRLALRHVKQRARARHHAERVARRIWAVAMKNRYGANDRSQKLKFHSQTSGRSLHAQEIAFNDIRTTLQALISTYDNTNSLHTNAYDEAITTPTEESVRRAMAIQLIINREWGIAKNENPNQGAFVIEALTDLALAGRVTGAGLWRQFQSDAPDAALRSNIRVFLAGALEATSSFASWALSHLARAPALQERILAEVRDIEVYEPENLAQAVTLKRALDETLRLTPALYFLPRKAVGDTWVETTDGRVVEEHPMSESMAGSLRDHLAQVGVQRIVGDEPAQRAASLSHVVHDRVRVRDHRLDPVHRSGRGVGHLFHAGAHVGDDAVGSCAHRGAVRRGVIGPLM